MNHNFALFYHSFDLNQESFELIQGDVGNNPRSISFLVLWCIATLWIDLASIFQANVQQPEEVLFLIRQLIKNTHLCICHIGESLKGYHSVPCNSHAVNVLKRAGLLLTWVPCSIKVNFSLSMTCFHLNWKGLFKQLECITRQFANSQYIPSIRSMSLLHSFGVHTIQRWKNWEERQ